ncbi:MAG: hypothetical protein ACI94O_000831 [Octadecabacter sp.]|jgi:hypothetical protein
MIDNNPIERLIYHMIALTWPFYAVGALFIVGPVLAWLLAGLVMVLIYLGSAVRPDMQTIGSIPPVIWGWLVGMFLMLIALWVGHLDWGLGTGKTIKSSIGWAKGWALLALFPLAGAVLPIRRETLIRAQCIVGLWTIILLPFLLLAPYVGLPERLYISPLKAIGGPGPEYFSVYLFSWDPSSSTPRWQFYAPWSPFAAILGIVMVLFAMEEKNIKWRCIGVVAGTVMIFATKSRMGLVGLVVCTIGPRLLPLILHGWAWQILAGFTAAMSLLSNILATKLTDILFAFKSVRADSTRVRETLQRIAIERWQSDGYWFGHATVEPGNHIVEYMPIGSHHTWYGLLFVKGLVGFCALLVPFVWQMALTLQDAAVGTRGRLPLGIMMTLTLLSFGENIEIEVYLLWPALVVLGIHLRELEGSFVKKLAFK